MSLCVGVKNRQKSSPVVLPRGVVRLQQCGEDGHVGAVLEVGGMKGGDYAPGADGPDPGQKAQNDVPVGVGHELRAGQSVDQCGVGGIKGQPKATGAEPLLDHKRGPATSLVGVVTLTPPIPDPVARTSTCNLTISPDTATAGVVATVETIWLGRVGFTCSCAVERAGSR